jgi:muramoyltetrapeptide carboxypeptidase
LRALQGGEGEGQLRGGCISILAAGLGTPYAPELRGSVLFLEDIGTKPYQWDRMLLHLRYAGCLDNVAGIVFGDMEHCGGQEEQSLLENAIIHGLRGFPGPVAIGLRCGHVNGANISLPLGVRVRLGFTDAANPRIDFLEPAVR